MSVRHSLATQIDGTAMRMGDLEGQLNVWWPTDRQLPGTLATIRQETLNAAIGALLKTPGSVSEAARRPAESALRAWTGRPRPVGWQQGIVESVVSFWMRLTSREYDAPRDAVIGHVALMPIGSYGKRTRRVVLAERPEPGSPALSLSVALGDPSSRNGHLAEAARVDFGKLDDTRAGVTGLTVYLSERNLNHGSSLAQVPTPKCAEKILPLVGEVKGALDDISRLADVRLNGHP